MLGILKRWAPWTYDAFLEHRLNAIHLSASAFRVVREMIAGRHVDQATSDLSNREWTELLTLLQSNAPPLPERP
jgi:thymidylate synthase (FAD)